MSSATSTRITVTLFAAVAAALLLPAAPAAADHPPVHPEAQLPVADLADLAPLNPALAIQEGPGRIVVSAVQGTVEWREGDGAWRTAKVGDTLPVGAEIATGFKSGLTLEFGTNSTVTVDPLTQVALGEFAYEDDEGVIRTKVGVAIGGIHYKVDPGKDVKSDFRVTAPNATASVSGSGGGVNTSPDKGDSFHSTENNLNVDAGNGPISLGPGQRTDGKKNPVSFRKSQRNSSRNRPGNTADENDNHQEGYGDTAGSDLNSDSGGDFGDEKSGQQDEATEPKNEEEEGCPPGFFEDPQTGQCFPIGQ